MTTWACTSNATHYIYKGHTNSPLKHGFVENGHMDKGRILYYYLPCQIYFDVSHSFCHKTLVTIIILMIFDWFLVLLNMDTGTKGDYCIIISPVRFILMFLFLLPQNTRDHLSLF